MGFASDTMAAIAAIGLFILLVFGGDFPAMDGADLSGINWEIAQHHMLYIMVFPLCLYHKLHYLFPCAGVLGSLATFVELLWGRC